MSAKSLSHRYLRRIKNPSHYKVINYEINLCEYCDIGNIVSIECRF